LPGVADPNPKTAPAAIASCSFDMSDSQALPTGAPGSGATPAAPDVALQQAPLANTPAVTIKVRRDGPLLITGAVRIVDPQGGEWQIPDGPNVALCRCGHSAQRPFCDGRHRELKFAADDRAPTSPASAPSASASATPPPSSPGPNPR
jgi:CDGSH-type Zn-finger protein